MNQVSTSACRKTADSIQPNRLGVLKVNPGLSRLYWTFRAYNQMNLSQQCDQLQAQLDARHTASVREGLAQLPLNRDDPEVQWALEQIETQLQLLEQKTQQLDLL